MSETVEQLIVSADRFGELQAQLNQMQTTINTMHENQIKLLQGVQRFFEMAEQMKGNPLFSALMPPSAPPQRRK